ANEGDFVGYMQNLGLPHPKQIDHAVPANLVCGKPVGGLPTTGPTWGPVVRTFGGCLEVDPVWVAEHHAQVLVLDVREPAELSGELGRIDGSLHGPVGELRARVAEGPATRPVVCICRSGRRSAQASVILEQAGRRDVANVAGGMIRWRALGL